MTGEIRHGCRLLSDTDMSRTGELGAAGEELAVAWLRAHGFIIMDRNWRMGRYELDIVAARGDRVHFVEVKLRRGTDPAGRGDDPGQGQGTAPGGQLLHRDLRGDARLSDRPDSRGVCSGRKYGGTLCAGCRNAQVVGLSVRPKFYTFAPCGRAGIPAAVYDTIRDACRCGGIIWVSVSIPVP